STGLASHIGSGSVNMLLNWLGGLQIQSRTEDRAGEWDWVKPLPGDATVNLGSAMATFTNGALKSAKHRVVPSPGEQGTVDCCSGMYFARPNNAVLMKPLSKLDTDTVANVAGKFSAGRGDDAVLAAAEWIRRRAIQLGN
ncbi:hypothetical protein C8A03DRAFT_18772, partial [Achaetomium macrosporum]